LISNVSLYDETMMFKRN